ncbi:MAG: TonB family protein [Verrucomicrobia bacterium]|nr:TonB family protein [Verrucomicrobiota bacterium]MBU1735890.1 TonB family protein [Verrucomicrobiota bacterium]MBU1856714.1 TonB family protein [Verrucomicrobiota bacterium]
MARSSGYPALDEAAMDAARRARYVSMRPGAWRAETETTLTFRFKLTE